VVRKKVKTEVTKAGEANSRRATMKKVTAAGAASSTAKSAAQ